MNCEIIKDLLPLYHDEVVSEESREMIAEHLNSCAECEKLLEDISESIKKVPVTEQPAVSGFRSLKKRLHRKTVIKIVVSVICAVAVVSALTFGVFFLETPVTYSRATRNMTYPVNSALDFLTHAGRHSSVSVFLHDDAMYICYSDTLWTRYFAKTYRNTDLAIYTSVIPEMPDEPVAPVEPDEPEIPDVPAFGAAVNTGRPSAPFAPGTPAAPDAPKAPSPAPNPFIQISEVRSVYYLIADFSKLANNEFSFLLAAGNAVLLWEG